MRAFLHKRIPGSLHTETTQVLLPPSKDGSWPSIVLWDNQLWVFSEEIVDHARYFQTTAVAPTEVIS